MCLQANSNDSTHKESIFHFHEKMMLRISSKCQDALGSFYHRSLQLYLPGGKSVTSKRHWRRKV